MISIVGGGIQLAGINTTAVVLTAILALVAVALTAIGMLVKSASKWGALETRVSTNSEKIADLMKAMADDRVAIRSALTQINDRVFTLITASISGKGE